MPILDKTRAALRVAAHLVAALAALGSSLGVSSGCSLVVESADRQCEQDADCGGFADAVCDVAGGVCVPRESTGPASTSAGSTATASTGVGSTGAGCVGPDGCFACEPNTQVELLNACTDAACIPYDNTQLEGLLEEDGSVPAVP